MTQPTLDAHSDSSPFWATYAPLVARILPPLQSGDGFPEVEIAAAEARLGFPLPQVLREFYLQAGRRADINTCHHRLIALDALEIEGDFLAFFEENQNCCRWAISLADPATGDPIVFREDSTDDPTWEWDFDHLSEFLTGMLFIQATLAGMPYVGVGSAATLESVSDAWTRITIGGTWNHTAYVRDGQALLVVGAPPNPEVSGGATTEDLFLELGEAFEVEWDYCTLDEE